MTSPSPSTPIAASRLDWRRALTGRTHVCGHRGHSIAAPENTLEALRETRARGGTTAEIDVVLTADGEIILLHDQTLDRTTNGRGAADAATLAEIATLDAGGWFDPRYAGEPVPTLRAALDLAHAIDLGLVVEVKEVQRVDLLLDRLKALLDETGLIGRIILISFNHVDLKRAKALIPGLKTEGITHARHADPVGVARAADLDSLSIEWMMFDEADARRLHDADIAIRCHVPRPGWFETQAGLGRDHRPRLVAALAAGLIDSLSGDDVGFLRVLVDEAGA
jgi:glycerophosphoryl diester phosphodiesterase